MKKLVISAVLVLLYSITTFANNATIHITVKNFRGTIRVYDPGLRYNLTRGNDTALRLDAHHSASYTVTIDKPVSLVLYFSSNSELTYNLYLSPGDELFLTADFSKKNNNFTVTGKGSENNQPEISMLAGSDLQAFKSDTKPDRVIATINKQFQLNKGILTNYIAEHKPWSGFIKATTLNLQYQAVCDYYYSYQSSIYGKPKDQDPKWRKIQDSLFLKANLNNDEALGSNNYAQFINFLIIRRSGDLWGEYLTNRRLFFKKWFNCDTVKGEKLFKEARQGILMTKVIDKYFKGKAAEFEYGQALKFVYHEADYPSAVYLFNHFKKKYPESAYVKGFSNPIAGIVGKQKNALSNKAIFVADNGAKLNTMNDVVKLTKGKTVLVDMWGTWCGPCRQEIQKNAKQLRDHFKGKNVIFLYIANGEAGREKEWKKQIAYFQIEGEHILANPKLTDDIMQKVKATGYPTYIIIKKDGSYKQAATRYPVNAQAMIKEIEAAGV
ncbi:TlpA disulfide reductase family protein [Mucilaginibacter sp.]|uniref:TlpA family protein disulfide reductase n=1 Tax=Mucilaginibacter sp. TaxID=1882438 RepID=UPI0025DBA81B|nr:TlpA disulfide reductase family protein [Mucilaginibacter sp.]